MKFAKVLALVMAVVMCVVSFASCGGNKSDTTIKLGLTGPLTGPYAIYGKAAANGAQIAVDEINANGGINGVKIEFKTEDDQGDGEIAINAYNSLLDWGIDALIGTVTSGACIAVSAETYADRVFTLTPSASSADVTKGKDNTFQVCFSDPNQGTGSAKYFANNFADAKIAIIYRNDDAYSQGIRDTFVAEAATLGLNIVYEGTFTEATQADFNVQLTQAKTSEADYIFLPIYYQPASVILKQADQMGYAPTFFGVDGMDGILTLENFDTSLAEGVMLLTPFSADAPDELTQNFVKNYQERFGEIPNQFAADGYDAIYVFVQAYEKAGCTLDMSTEEICEKLIGVMTEIEYTGLTGKGLTWNAEGEVSKDPLAVVIKDGVYVTP